MNRRLFCIALLTILCSSVAFPASAKDGESGDDDSGSDSGESGHGGDNEDEQDDEDDDKSGDDNDDDVHDDDNGSGDDGSGDDHDDAKDAVDANEVLPLRQILALLRKRGDYTVIDVKLQRSSSVIRYVLKCIDNSGAVLRIVFDAKTGAVVN